MNRSPILPLVLGLVATVAHGQQQARIVKYHVNDIVSVRAKMRYTTLIELPSTEKIMEVASGDKDFWIIDAVGNYCFLHPAKEGIHSNLNLITDKGTVYSFTLDDVESGDPDLKVVIEPSDPSSLAAANGVRQLVPASEVEAARTAAQMAQTRAATAVELFRSEYPTQALKFDYVGHLGDWRIAAAIFLEWHGLSGYPPPRREARKDVAPTLSARAHGGGGLGTDFDLDGGLIRQLAFGGNNTAGPIDVATAANACASASGRMDFETETFITHPLSADGFDASEDGTGRGVPLIAGTLSTRYGASSDRDLSDSSALLPLAFNLRGREGGAMPEPADAASVRAASGGSSNSYVAFSAKDHGADASEIAPTLRGMGHESSHANGGGQVAVAFTLHGSDGTASTATVVNGVSDGVGVQFFLKDVGSGLKGSLLAINLLVGGILLKYWRAGETEKL